MEFASNYAGKGCLAHPRFFPLNFSSGGNSMFILESGSVGVALVPKQRARSYQRWAAAAHRIAAGAAKVRAAPCCFGVIRPWH